MSPPINIDGNSISGITIDGKKVQKVTIDGQVAYQNAIDAAIDASGGTTVTTYNGYKIHAFENVGSDTFSVNSAPSNATVDVLIAAGGGGGGGSPHGGGGGAGGLVYVSNYSITTNNYSITVGGGGTGGIGDNGYWNTSRGDNGGDSYFDGIQAIGGGAGGAFSGINGADGGSGGGATDHTYPGNALQPGNTSYNDYGNGSIEGPINEYSSGGGGAGQRGSPNGNSAGGDGKYFGDEFSDIFGENGYFAGGGGGAIFATSGGNGVGNSSKGGKGGGGNGGVQDGYGSFGHLGDDAMSNTGGGGGASERNKSLDPSTRADGGNGGSGIVLVRYPI